ncbi:hypothetical protein A3Q56_04310 [Intoshia linei]|uniref:EF-hand domain-containing protein n=1 Tax=Intoshia linei TaxID=1819745 RepID=A0A177B101_9BILA|nr:hypothetical protein A3Q56_04310 [Intoshia linei]
MDQKVTTIKEAFGLYDKGNYGKIKTELLGPCLRTAGIKCSTGEVVDYISRNDTTKSGFITFSQFSEIAIPIISEGITNESVLEAFQLFDVKNTGAISKFELKHIMTNLGDKLSEDDVHEMLQPFDTNINYRGNSCVTYSVVQ